MQSLNTSQDLSTNDSAWFFLAEYSLSKFLFRQNKKDERASVSLFQAVQELGIPPECAANIEIMLKRYAEEASVHFEHGKEESAGLIRIFCQKKRVADPDALKTSMPYLAEPGMERAPAVPYSNPKMNGGWGYFLIERGGNPSNGSSVSSRNSIDLYLYREGE